MKFVVFLVVVVFAVAQAKYLMAPYALSEALEKNEIDVFIHPIHHHHPTPRQISTLTSLNNIPNHIFVNRWSPGACSHQKEKLYIPMARYMSCSNGGCTAVCQALGYRHGVCVSDTTCECYN
ncbi:hypothetical protein MSG28_001417 [Choristoneura fumiferana]|uniref:Uncharacterized protein n=1 Tax=Choristoneura fumiferana TaxID=7141 RepID=A0ACC0KUX1_CHOFU|nr:hypothetical protein MSG28_001417 [Choristoneura fumiferana]